MEIQDLRVGNIISHLGQTTKIIGIASTGYLKGDFYHHELILDNGSYEASLNHCKGLEISEEILLKCGFVKTDIGIVLNIKNMQIGLIAMRGKWNLGISGPFGLVQPRYIGFLHDLQNIVYALTGQELNTSGL